MEKEMHWHEDASNDHDHRSDDGEHTAVFDGAWHHHEEQEEDE